MCIRREMFREEIKIARLSARRQLDRDRPIRGENSTQKTIEILGKRAAESD